MLLFTENYFSKLPYKAESPLEDEVQRIRESILLRRTEMPLQPSPYGMARFQQLVGMAERLARRIPMDILAEYDDRLGHIRLEADAVRFCLEYTGDRQDRQSFETLFHEAALASLEPAAQRPRLQLHFYFLLCPTVFDP